MCLSVLYWMFFTVLLSFVVQIVPKVAASRASATIASQGGPRLPQFEVPTTTRIIGNPRISLGVLILAKDCY